MSVKNKELHVLILMGIKVLACVLTKTKAKMHFTMA